MTGPTVTKLVKAALAESEDGHERWRYVAELHRRNDAETFVAARDLARSSDRQRRILGVDILGQLGATAGVGLEDREFRGPAVELLLELVHNEPEPTVLHAIGIAFGHLNDLRCIAPLRRLRSHDDADVRYAVAFGLCALEEDGAIETLIELSADPSAAVRDWATFGLGVQTDRDTPEIRDAFVARLDDPDLDTREEALRGLALRGDERAIIPTLDAVKDVSESSDPGRLQEAAISLAKHTRDPRLCPYLTAERESWVATLPEEPVPDELEEAIRCACGEDRGAA